jgi:hypothetical protein
MAIITPDLGYIGDLKCPSHLKGQCHEIFEFFRSIVDTGGKFATGINKTSETGGKICRRCR